MKKKQLILSLIKDNLINTRLVSALIDLDLSDAPNYHLHLSDTILKLAGVKVSDKHYKNYLNLFNQVKKVNVIEETHKLDKMTMQIYKAIQRKKINQGGK
jgi:hypothetical protein